MKRLLLFFLACTPPPPTWLDAPAEISVLQGHTLALPFVLSADTTASVSAGDMDVVVEGERLIIRAAIGSPATSTLEVVLGDDETRYDIAVDIGAIDWQQSVSWQLGEGPQEREHGTVIYHRDTEQIYLFGGSGYHPQIAQQLTDYWRYDIASQTWTEITPVGALPPAASRRFAGTWGSGEGLLFGGYTPANRPINLNELYRVRVVDGTLHFTALEQRNPPPARSLHGFAKVPNADRFYVFGGFTDSGFVGDTWTMILDDDVAEWTLLELELSPTPRYGFFAAVDEHNGRWLLFSGGQQPLAADSVNAAQDTWTFDFAAQAWQPIISDDTPAGRRNGCAVFDGESLFILGGTQDARSTEPGVFVLDANRPGEESWHELSVASPSPDLRSSGFGFSDGESVYCGFGNGLALYRDWTILGF